VNNEFLRDLKRVYLEIDKFSNLTWSMRDNFEFINNGRSNTRSRISDKDKEDSAKWQQETNAQLGYGEITRGALTNLLSIFQNAGRFIEEDQVLMK